MMMMMMMIVAININSDDDKSPGLPAAAAGAEQGPRPAEPLNFRTTLNFTLWQVCICSIKSRVLFLVQIKL